MGQSRALVLLNLLFATCPHKLLNTFLFSPVELTYSFV